MCRCGHQCVSGTDSWQRVNTGMPVKSPRFAMFDLAEGKSYSFRVRCCNSAGVGEASVSTGEITVGDILGEICSNVLYLLCCHQLCLTFTFLLPSDLPSAPANPVAIRNTDTSVVVTWGASKDVKSLVGYYLECSQVGTNIWMPCNNKPIKQTRSVFILTLEPVKY